MLDAPALAGLSVLLVDDVSDSGRTLALVLAMLRESAAEVRCATLYTKPRTVLIPDYTWRETDDWIVFPWSALPIVDAPEVTALLAPIVATVVAPSALENVVVAPAVAPVAPVIAGVVA
jgi:hypothetical protein